VTRPFGATVAVRELSLEVYAGEVFGLLGHNGAGKKTIRLLTGLLLPDAGTITVLGRSLETDGAAIRARSGVLSELPGLDERLTVWETLAFFAELFSVPSPEVPARVTSLLEQFGLTEQADARVARFSKGMKQRLALARCLLHDPELLFL
jgi:ABC-2 type transport system ATP-binding protein